MNDELKAALWECTRQGNIFHTPKTQLDRKLYVELKKTIENAGGKWKGGKVQGFVFDRDPTEIISKLRSGEAVDIKQKYQFFATPDKLADKLVSLVDWSKYKYPSILEPSAGQGALVKAVLRKKIEFAVLVMVELLDTNRMILDKEFCNYDHPHIKLHNEPDFMKYTDDHTFDVIIANPPFSNNQDVMHIKTMYDHLNQGGTLVCITSKHWEFAGRNIERLFREWIMDLDDCEVIDVDPGEFKSSGTTVATNIVIIRK